MSSQNAESFIKMIKSKSTKIPDIVSFLRNNTIEINALDSHGYNALHYAIKQENCELVNLLLTIEPADDTKVIEKADPNFPTDDVSNSITTSPLFLALFYVNDEEKSNKIIKTLIKMEPN